MPPDSSLHLHWRLEVVGTNDPVLRIAQSAPAPVSGGRRLEVWGPLGPLHCCCCNPDYRHRALIPGATIHAAATLSFGWKNDNK